MQRVLALDLGCNVITISRITKDLKCSVTFFDDYCVLQDRTSRMSIGAVSNEMGSTTMMEN